VRKRGRLAVYMNYIDGKWTESRSGDTFQSINPANGEVLGTLTRSTSQDVEEAVVAARKALDSWRKVPAPRRGEILFRAGEMMVRRKEELGRLLTQEMGKVLPEALGDVQEGIDMTFFIAGEGRRLLGETTQAELPNKFAMVVRDPVGVVGAITPWNFPFAIPTWKLMPALVAGNTVVFKPSSETSIMAVKLVGILEEAGLPPGVLNLVLGPGDPVGEAVIQHPGIDLISFTGSTEVGRAIQMKTAPRLQRVSLEMGGKNAIIVMEDADLELALEGILWSAFGTTGQRCTAASRIIVHQAVRERLTEMLVERARRMRLGDGLCPTSDMGPLINGAQLEKVHRYTKIGLEEGARLLTGGEIYREGECAKGFFYPPTIFTDVQPGMRIAQEEIFGPTTVIITVDSLEEAIQINNGTGYGLVASIYTRDVNRAFVAMRDITTGIVYVNAGTTGAEIQLPFGGTRGTGNGHREAGRAALEVYTEWKTIYVDYSGRLQRAQIDV
jgi:aldehyde dehydrogenase (NAD+)